ncbi:phosphotransferase enzyme family protein [Dyella sp. KRB-257]|uniref:phosphotransferase enzyme family protein n=1 Tax=Dyella sp. KRB-257 TaxID=3400915 RepID=UPI003C018689
MTDSPHRVHGLAGDEIAPDWPALTGDEVHALLDAMPQLVPPRRIVWHSPRPLSAACLVQTGGGTVFVKRHHRSVRSAATLREEHDFIAHLRRAGMPLARLLADAHGDTAHAHGDWVYEVHEQADGIDLYRETISWSPPTRPAHAFAAGQMLACLHRAAQGHVAEQRSTHVLVARSELATAADPAQALAAQLHERPGLADYLRGRDWRRDLAALFAPWRHAQPALARQPRLWTHGDWHVSNLCWSGAGDDATITTVLDLGLAAANFALFDLATAIERNAIAWLELDSGNDAVHADIALALIAGYRRRRPLDRSDVHLLAELLPVVHVDFALSEVEYFHAATKNRRAADVAYDTFLRGHAAWFSTPPGQALLDAIRAAA